MKFVVQCLAQGGLSSALKVSWHPTARTPSKYWLHECLNLEPSASQPNRLGYHRYYRMAAIIREFQNEERLTGKIGVANSNS